MDNIAVTLKLPTKSVTQKRTLTHRSDSSGSESSSPLDKRLKNSTHAEHEGEVQEVLEGAPESPLAVDMSEKWTEKLDQILVKLNKLDSIETTLNNLCAEMTIVESDVSKLKDGARVTEKNLKEMDDGLQWMNTELEGLKLQIKFLETAKEDLHTQHLYAEAYSRRENLKFFGLAEEETKSNQEGSEAINTRNILFEFLENGLGLENPVLHLSKQDVSDLLQVTLNNMYFSFRDQVFRQREGLPMGSSISSILAILFMDKLESIALSSHLMKNPYKRYVDDIYLQTTNEETADHFHKIINNVHPNLKFEIEKPQATPNGLSL